MIILYKKQIRALRRLAKSSDNVALVRMKGIEDWNTNFFNFNTIYGG